MKTNQYIVFLFGLILLISGKAFAAPGMSEINNELFDKAHLKNIDQPGVLKYKFSKPVLLMGTALTRLK